jgi:hypothetical protein
MKKYFIALIFSFMTTSVIADNKLKLIDDNCVRAYARADALLQFLYKFDGNLPSIKETKIKSLNFSIAQFKDYKSSKEIRRKAFGELFNDPDYYQLLIQEKSSNLIKELEEFKSKSSPTKDKNLIYTLPNVSSFGDYQNPYLKIKKLVGIQNNVRDFFDELESSKIRLEELNQQHRLRKSLDNDPQSLAFTIVFNKTSMTEVIECNLSYLEAERTSK